MSKIEPREVLVVNCGSSSLKLALIESTTGLVVCKALAERLGTQEAGLSVEIPGVDPTQESLPGADHGGALERLLEICLPDSAARGRIVAVGHRVVHGGTHFRDACVVDETVIQKIDDCASLAPLHNPANRLGIQVAQKQFPGVPHVAVFDTAFHQTMPPRAFFYAVPYEWYEDHAARRYGFHGTSHQFVFEAAAALLDLPASDSQWITAHLGNGCSVCAIKNGESLDTSMGLTPLEGLVMGTRSGDVDPNLAEFIAKKTGTEVSEITDALSRKSGLLGLSGLSNDMRTLVEAASSGNRRAELAIDVFCYRLARQILSMAAALERIDALVFTGGIGEHSALVRTQTLAHLKILGARIDEQKNASHGRENLGIITAAESSGLRAMVVSTNEEWMIAKTAARICETLCSP